jgi:hypothetical protein
MDEELERAIDRAGRDHVFARAQSYGWGSGSTPPAWVWWHIVQELILEQSPLPTEATGPRLVVDNTDRGVPPT